MIAWSIAETEKDRESVVLYLCRNGEKLGLPFNWKTVVNFLVYAMEDNGLLIGKDDTGEAAGVVAYTLGTDDDRYQDRSRIEIHLVYIEESRRGGAGLLAMMRMFVRHLFELPAEIREIVFYAEPTSANKRLYGKLAALVKVSEQPCGPMDFYAVDLEELRRFDSFSVPPR